MARINGGQAGKVVGRRPTSMNYRPPWDGLTFTLEAGSDELRDELKRIYPECPRNDQRELQAVIDYLQEELDRSMQRVQQTTAGVLTMVENGSSASPTSTSIDLQASTPSRLGSRSGSSYSYSSPTGSPPQEAQHVYSPQPNAGRRTNTSLPSPVKACETFVFDSSNGAVVQPKTRKKMSQEEKQQYKETRRRGACFKCKQQKGKCTHPEGSTDQPSGTIAPKSRKRKSGEPEHDRPGPTKHVKPELDSEPRRRSPDPPRAAVPQPKDQFPGQQNEGDGNWTPRGDQGQMYVTKPPTGEPFAGPPPMGNSQPGWPLPTQPDMLHYNPGYTGLVSSAPPHFTLSPPHPSDNSYDWNLFGPSLAYDPGPSAETSGQG